MNKTCLLIFPPNWSACVSGPHLAMPLMAGVAKQQGWSVETLDLSNLFYRSCSNPPDRKRLEALSASREFEALDNLYFDWEDQLRNLSPANEFGLLSGYSFSWSNSLRLSDVSARVKESGTIFGPWFTRVFAQKLALDAPDVVAVTVASQHQIIPVIELLRLIRNMAPDALLVLGGNVITRLRQTSAFETFCELADHVVLFQGELAFAEALRTVTQFGSEAASRILSKVSSDELISPLDWPVPEFDGINFDEQLGLPFLPYVSTRGCYWGKCHFCAIPAGWSETGYAGSAPAEFVAKQLTQMTTQTGIRRVKFVDEAIAPNKVRHLSKLLRETRTKLEWEAYARLERSWEDPVLLRDARAGGLTKLYFGLEQSPETNRDILGKNDRADMNRVLQICSDQGIAVHLFCMVGHPRSSRDDAKSTVEYLIKNEAKIDTADLVGFRLDRGTIVPGVRPMATNECDWNMSLSFEPVDGASLWPDEIAELESDCQDQLWEAVPRLLHPLYRTVSAWRATTSLV